MTGIVLAYLPALVAVLWGLPVLTSPDRAGPGPLSPIGANVEGPDLSRLDVISPRPVDNDCSGGFVHLTFDDGPFVYTPYVLDHLDRLNIEATFYVVGERVETSPEMVRRQVSEGHSVQNHTFSHPNLLLTDSLDRAGPRVLPWGGDQVRTELARTNAAIVDAGGPRPTEYRPPYGSVNRQVDALARRLGLRLVMAWSEVPGRIVYSADVQVGVTSADIERTVTSEMRAGSIIVMHDGSAEPTLNSLYALQGIVDAMNEKNLCSSTRIPIGATGGALAPFAG